MDKSPYINELNLPALCILNMRIYIVITYHSFFSTTVSVTNVRYFQHFCMTWQNSADGTLKVYVNGSLKYASKLLQGYFPAGGGVWVIGQEQDELGGGFDADQAFGGELTELNVWDRVLSPAEITKLASTCSSNNTQGNYLAYSDFHIEENVERFKPPCCN